LTLSDLILIRVNIYIYIGKDEFEGRHVFMAPVVEGGSACGGEFYLNLCVLNWGEEDMG